MKASDLLNEGPLRTIVNKASSYIPGTQANVSRQQQAVEQQKTNQIVQGKMARWNQWVATTPGGQPDFGKFLQQEFGLSQPPTNAANYNTDALKAGAIAQYYKQGLNAYRNKQAQPTPQPAPVQPGVMAPVTPPATPASTAPQGARPAAAPAPELNDTQKYNVAKEMLRVAAGGKKISPTDNAGLNDLLKMAGLIK